MKLLKTLGILLIIVAVFGGAMFGLNIYTEPLIAERQAGAANERLDAVMPEGDKEYEDITATLTLPEKFVSATNDKRTADIVAVHKETKNGFGYIVEVAWTSEDSHGSEPNLVLVGISPDGKIIKLNNENYHDTEAYNIFNKDPNYTATFENQDSTLADVGTVAGSTHSSESFRSAVAHAFEVLVVNNMITAGVKSDAQILEELIPTVAPGFTTLLDANASGNIQKALKSENGAGFAYIMTAGEKSYLAVVNAMGICKLYDVEGNDVTADNASLADEAKAKASADQQSFESKANRKLKNLFEGADGFEPLVIDGFTSIVYATKFTVGEANYYGFYSRSKGYGQMDIYVVIDENGAIVKISAATLFFDTEHFPVDDNFDTKGYESSFEGLTGETFTGENATIAGATYSAGAMKQATKDAFAAFEFIKGGEQ